MKEIELKNGGSTLVDDEDFEELSKSQWLNTHRGYVVRYVGKSILRMHRVVMDLSLDDERCVDHINGNRLDNRRSNLRVCTKSENAKNRKVYRTNTSGYRGVSWHKKNKKWQAKIKSNGKVIYLGEFTVIEDAAEAYRVAANELHGDFVRTEA